MPTVSILTATYNRHALLPEAIASLRAQTYDDWEMLVLDDGSEPSAEPIVDSFADPRLRYISLEHGGLPTARNKGLELARGTHIGFLDDDDLYHPDKLASEVAFLKANPDIDIVGSGYRITGKDGQIIQVREPWLTKPDLNERNILFGVPLLPCSVLVARRAITRLEYWFDPIFDCGVGDDTDFFTRLFLAGARFGWVKEILSDYRRLDKRDRTVLMNSWRAYHQIFDKVFRTPGLPPEIAAQKQDVLNKVELHYAWMAYAAGAIQTGRRFLLQALIREPRLAGNQADLILESLATFSQNETFVNDPHSFIERVLAHLPSPLEHLSEQGQRLRQLATRENYACS
ncbi:MAG: glycosyltransferase [Anaerolineae bacterium]|nr:glycosyltransferase [Anaerolineae bacterium]